MYIKRYTIAAFVWIALVGWYVYAYVTQVSTSIDFFGIPMPSLSVALWVILPIIILYIASVFHMTFYSIIGNFKLRKYEKDFEKIINEISDKYLGKTETNYSYKTERYQLLGALLEKSIIYPVGDIGANVKNEKINSVLTAIESVKNGEVTDLKQFSLPIDNELVLQNTRNRYKKGELKADEILSNEKKYSESLRKEVYIDYVKTASLANIKKYMQYLNKDALDSILERINADEHTLEISNEDLISLCAKVTLSKDDFIKLSITLSKGDMIPEQRMKLFEILSEKYEDAIDAYLFTLYDLEMLAPANAILDNSQEHEYENFKAYRALKECGENFSIYIFV